MNPNDAIAKLRDKVGIDQTLNDDGLVSNIADLLVNVSKQQPDDLALTCLGHSMTFAQLDALSDDFAVYLQQHTELTKGDRIAIQLPNLLQYPVVFYGALKAGMVVVNTNPLYTDRELKHQFTDADVKALVTVANIAHQVQDVLPATNIKHVIITELADLHSPLKRVVINNVARHIKKMVPKYNIPNALSFRQCMSKGRKGKRQPIVTNKEDLALLQYTGGTTGPSKGAMLSHHNIVCNVQQAKAAFDTFNGFEDDDKTAVLPLPLYHVFACQVLTQFIGLGAHCLLIPNPRDLDSVIKAISAWRIACFIGLNTLFVSLCSRDEFKKLDFSNLKITVSGGMALTKDAAKTWEDVTGCLIYEGFGLTETSPVVSINVGNPDGSGRKLGSIGVAAPSTELKVIDEEGNSLACGERGELCVRGPQVMQGYWNQPEKTAEVITEDGWFLTGDVALIGEDGFPHIVDRKKDMVIVSGFNVYPNEVEDVISSHENVIECAVVGGPDDKTGERVKLFVVTKEPMDAKELITFARKGLAGYKVPAEVIFMDDLPKSNVGKILRRELRD